jgi:anti-anti-sigma factor
MDNSKNNCLISLSGKLDDNFVHRFNKSLQTLASTESKDITLDLEQVDQIDSNGLGFLLALKKNLIRNKHDLILLHPSKEVLKQFKKTALNDSFEIIP